jgi:ubiquinone/menaquinone biosynthesis C-methylase UbiE
MSVYDAAAPTFDRHRALPDGAPEAIRAAVLEAVEAASPRLLDLGAGTGRIGIPFIAARDDYVGVDLSFGMLSEFKRRAADRAFSSEVDTGSRQENASNQESRAPFRFNRNGKGSSARAPRLVQADGEHLPFRDATFDAVMLIQVFGGMRGWRRLLAEARRVLRGAGVLVLGRTLAPPDGLDARMKARLALLLDEIGASADRTNTRQDAQGWLEQQARGTRLVAATWTARRTPREFIERHGTGARFSPLPAPVKEEAMRRLAAWAATAFGSLDAASVESHGFELQLFRFS